LINDEQSFATGETWERRHPACSVEQNVSPIRIHNFLDNEKSSLPDRRDIPETVAEFRSMLSLSRRDDRKGIFSLLLNYQRTESYEFRDSSRRSTYLTRSIFEVGLLPQNCQKRRPGIHKYNTFFVKETVSRYQSTDFPGTQFVNVELPGF